MKNVLTLRNVDVVIVTGIMLNVKRYIIFPISPSAHTRADSRSRAWNADEHDCNTLRYR